MATSDSTYSGSSGYTDRTSGARTLSSEINRAFGSPKSDHVSEEFRKRESDSVSTDFPERVSTPTEHSDIEVDEDIEDVPPDHLLSPQPKTSVRKILQLTGVNTGGKDRRESAPRGHNSKLKIKQLTGLVVDDSVYKVNRSPMTVSPISTTSSVHSADLSAAVSEPEIEERSGYCESSSSDFLLTRPLLTRRLEQTRIPVSNLERLTAL